MHQSSYPDPDPELAKIYSLRVLCMLIQPLHSIHFDYRLESELSRRAEKDHLFITDMHTKSVYAVITVIAVTAVIAAIAVIAVTHE